MKLSVFCRQPRCKGVEAARMADGNAYQLALLVLASHTMPPHGNSHPLEIKVDDGPVPEGKHELKLCCINPICAHPREIIYRVDKEFTGACAIAFHSIHEGHAFTMHWDGAQLHPPLEL